MITIGVVGANIGEFWSFVQHSGIADAADRVMRVHGTAEVGLITFRYLPGLVQARGLRLSGVLPLPGAYIRYSESELREFQIGVGR